jgi:hypothetical protein
VSIFVSATAIAASGPSCASASPHPRVSGTPDVDVVTWLRAARSMSRFADAGALLREPLALRP